MLLKGIDPDPRYKAFLRKMSLPEKPTEMELKRHAY